MRDSEGNEEVGCIHICTSHTHSHISSPDEEVARTQDTPLVTTHSHTLIYMHTYAYVHTHTYSRTL